MLRSAAVNIPLYAEHVADVYKPRKERAHPRSCYQPSPRKSRLMSIRVLIGGGVAETFPSTARQTLRSLSPTANGDPRYPVKGDSGRGSHGIVDCAERTEGLRGFRFLPISPLARSACGRSSIRRTGGTAIPLPTADYGYYCYRWRSSTRRCLNKKCHRPIPRITRTELYSGDHRLVETRSTHGHLPGAGEDAGSGAGEAQDHRLRRRLAHRPDGSRHREVRGNPGLALGDLAAAHHHDIHLERHGVG